MSAGCWIALALGCAGCVVHLTGIVAPLEGGHGTGLTTPEGAHYRLLLGPESLPLAGLDGHEAQVDGTRIGESVRVHDWQVITGLHGLQVFVGPLEHVGIQVGIDDRGTGSLLLLDESSWDVLGPLVGRTVLVEGWVEGAHRLRVVYYRVLVPEDPSRGDAP